MAFGWLGVISALVNLAMVPSNALGLFKAGRLEATPNPSSLDPGRPVLLRAGGAIGTVVMLVAAGFVVSTAVNTIVDTSESVEALTVGDCIDDPGNGDFDRVNAPSCDEPHDWEIYLSTNATGFGSEYPGDFELATHINDRCYDGFEGYVGTSFQNSLYTFDFLFPTIESWTAGDRGFLCLVGTGERALTTSVRNSGR